MNDAPSMRVVECVGQAHCVVNRLFETDTVTVLRETLGERLARHAFHDEVIDSAIVANIVQCAYVWMTQQRNGLCLALQPLAELRVTREPGTQDFDRDGPFQSQIACFVHLAHPALADVRNYFVSAKTGPNGQTGDHEQ